jgi:hypothetical protein
MSYVTLEIEIDHGRVLAKEGGQLPDKATGLFTILPTPGGCSQESVVNALEALQAYLRVDEKKAADWMMTVRDSRR